MALYPITTLDIAVATSEPTYINPGTLIVIPLDMIDNEMLQIYVWQMSMTEDFSLRAWVSLYENGIAYAPGAIPIIRFGGAPIVVYVASQTPPANAIGVLVPPGEYFLNILNLTNNVNVFGMALM